MLLSSADAATNNAALIESVGSDKMVKAPPKNIMVSDSNDAEKDNKNINIITSD